MLSGSVDPVMVAQILALLASQHHCNFTPGNVLLNHHPPIRVVLIRPADSAEWLALELEPTGLKGISDLRAPFQ
jgi:hypothetical protein